MKIMCPKHEKLNKTPCAEAEVPILNTPHIVLDPGGVMGATLLWVVPEETAMF